MPNIDVGDNALKGNRGNAWTSAASKEVLACHMRARALTSRRELPTKMALGKISGGGGGCSQ